MSSLYILTEIIPSFSFALCNQIDQLKCYESIVMLMREADGKWWQVSVVSHLVHTDGNCWVQVNIGVEMILHPSSINTTNWFELNMSNNYHRMMGLEMNLVSGMCQGELMTRFILSPVWLFDLILSYIRKRLQGSQVVINV